MEAKQKSLECQLQVKQNAEELRTTFMELYEWEKEMKIKEKELQKRPTEANVEKLKEIPIRNDAAAATKNNKQVDENKIVVDAIVTDKNDIEPKRPCTIDEEIRKKANDIKNRGNVLVKKGAYEEAITEYSSAIDLFGKDPIFYSNRALCHLKLENYKKCIEDCESALEIDDKTVKAIYRRMQANESLGNVLDALKDCTTILALDPKNIEAKKSLDRINKRLSSNAKTPTGCCFTPMNKNLVDILPYRKPMCRRSRKPIHRVTVVDIVAPRNIHTNEYDTLKISDEDIDKIFNSNCGPYVEIKKGTPEYEENERRKQLRYEENKAKNKIETTTILEKNTKNQKNSADKIGGDIPTAHAYNILEKIDKDIQNTTDARKVAANKNLANKLAATKKIVETAPKKIERPLPKAPVTTGEFYSNWKELTSVQKYQYMRSIPISKLCKILGASFDSDLLSDMLRVIHDYYLPNNELATGATLLEISKNSQLRILSLLMSNDDRKVLAGIINTVKEHKSNISVVDLISKNFGLLQKSSH